MKLEWLRADIASARRATTFLAVLLTGSLLVNVVLALLTVRMSDRERVVLVPPTINKTFWVESERVSAEYLQQMAYFLMQLTLDVTPHSVDHQASVLMQYAAPASYGELRTAMAATADRLKRDGASTVFSARDLVVDEATQRVGVRGQLTTYVSDRRVSEVSKATPSSCSTPAAESSSRHFARPIPMTPWKPSLILLPLLLLVDPAHALQIVDAQDGQTALGKVSRKEVTRIASSAVVCARSPAAPASSSWRRTTRRARSSCGPPTRKAPSRSTSSSHPIAAPLRCCCSRSTPRATRS
jgi:conjugal transfer pilus assembly protein TraE